MARINVEDSIYRDHRFVKLCALVGSMEAALGTLVLAWDLAQRAFWRGTTNVPIEQMRTRLNYFQQLVDCGLASVVDGAEVYIAGSEDAFKSLEIMRANRRAAGQKSAQVRKKKAERTKLTRVNRTQHNSTKSNPSTSTSTSVDSPSENSDAPPALAVGDGYRLEEKYNPVALWCAEYKRFRGYDYDMGGKEAGMLMNWARGKSCDRAQEYFCAYLSMKEPLYEREHWPLSLFFRDKAKINAGVKTGVDPTNSAGNVLDQVFKGQKQLGGK